MADSRENLEQKLLSETLSYARPDELLEGFLRNTDIAGVVGAGIAIEEKLFTACKEGDLETVREILEQNNLGVNILLRSASTPLMIAAEYNQTRLVNFLLKQPGIKLSMANHDDQTALNCALQAWNGFEGANYAMALDLIAAGADINQAVSHMNVLLASWADGNQEAANNLTTLLGASILVSENLFNQSPVKMESRGAESIPQQIGLSKKHREGYINDHKRLGINIRRMCFGLPEEFDLKIAELLFNVHSLEMRAFNAGCDIRNSLQTPPPSPRPFTFMRTRQSEIFNQTWVEKYKGHNQLSDRGKDGYGPGAMDTP